jgi:hypothetical protein
MQHAFSRTRGVLLKSICIPSLYTSMQMVALFLVITTVETFLDTSSKIHCPHCAGASMFVGYFFMAFIGWFLVMPISLVGVVAILMLEKFYISSRKSIALLLGIINVPLYTLFCEGMVEIRFWIGIIVGITGTHHMWVILTKPRNAVSLIDKSK